MTGEYIRNMGGHWPDIDEKREGQEKERHGVHSVDTPQAGGFAGERGRVTVGNNEKTIGDGWTRPPGITLPNHRRDFDTWTRRICKDPCGGRGSHKGIREGSL
jgi:hypothetical protein